MLKKHSKLQKINSHNLPLYKSTLDDKKNDTTPQGGTQWQRDLCS